MTASPSTPPRTATHKERQKASTPFHHRGLRICKTTFLFLHVVGDFRFRAIKAQYLAQGVVPRVYSYTGRVTQHGVGLQDVEDLMKFILQYAESNAILFPGLVPGYKRDDIQILPSFTTKKVVWLLYSDTCGNLAVRALAYSPSARCGASFCDT